MSTTQFSAASPSVVAERADSPQPLLTIDPELFRANFARHPMLLGHRLANHPLFSLARLVELARSTPEEYVEYNAGEIPISVDARKTPHNGLSIEETIRRIEENRSWMVIKRIERDSEYDRFLNVCLDEVEVHTSKFGRRQRMHQRAASVFISSPGSITPYHLDHECNFLLQIRGRKSISVFDPADRSILAEQDLENYFSSTAVHRNLQFRDEYQAKAMVFDLVAGQALHIPSTAPHWVRNGPEVSISFSVAYQTLDSDRRISLHQLNHRLRQRGWKPAPVGQSPARDTLKLATDRVLNRLQRTFAGKGAADVMLPGTHA